MFCDWVRSEDGDQSNQGGEGQSNGPALGGMGSSFQPPIKAESDKEK
jgi:hypothetical protein